MALLDRYDPDGIFRLWEQQPTILLCDIMARKGLSYVAQDGVCIVHGGDACLFQYVQVSALTRALESAVAASSSLPPDPKEDT